jgi:O-acetyl-ADP-ribose deacetylase (regulator of RNase III)
MGELSGSSAARQVSREPVANRAHSGQDPGMAAPDALPAHAAVVKDLRLLRGKGLIRLRVLDLPALRLAARLSGASGPGGDDATGVEVLLRESVDALGGDDMGKAAEYLFGLVRGTIGRRPTYLRERAADCYGMTPETFRKEPERLLIAQVAEEILKICQRGHVSHAPHVTQVSAPPTGHLAEDSTRGARAGRRSILAALHQVLSSGHGVAAGGEQRSAGAGLGEIKTYGPFVLPVGPSSSASLTLHAGSIEGLENIDIIVSSENVHLELAKPFKSSLSARLRNAAAYKNAAGEVVDDVISREVSEWIRENARPGLPVEPGTVVATSSGRLVHRGIRRIYHAAVVVPRAGTNEYDVDLESIYRAVRATVQLAKVERRTIAPALRSICFPLFGTGRAGLDPAVSFAWMWPALQQELAADDSWEIHISAGRADSAAAVLRELLREVED